ncbi:hypothetical protein ANO11243_051010 [Dothideomycetidae sp. 11243]|nr:hypothetical protein ANO11243_051010 [fungal sp. No.11243]
MDLGPSVYTFNLPGLVQPNLSFVGSVATANAQTTQLILNCPLSGPSATGCGVTNASYTIGPWAQATPPPDASTGTFDLLVTTPGENSATVINGTTHIGESAVYSVHCSMTHTTQAVVCTTTNGGDNNDGRPTATITDPDQGIFGAVPVVVQITAGLGELAAASGLGTMTAEGSSSATVSASATDKGSSSATETTSGSASGTAASASATSKSAAGMGRGVNMKTVGLITLVATWFMIV